MDISFLTDNTLTPVQIIGVGAAGVAIWIVMAALLGHSARVFMGVEGVNLVNDAALAILGGVFTLITLREFDISIADFILQHAPRSDTELVWFAEIATASFFGACGLRLVFDLR